MWQSLACSQPIGDSPKASEAHKSELMKKGIALLHS